MWGVGGKWMVCGKECYERFSVIETRSILGKGTPEDSPGGLQEILSECARLRGVPELEHRTLHEFDCFVGELIFEPYTDISQRWKQTHYTLGTGQLTRLAQAFLEYCREQYSGPEAN
jgi:hypothetical protein